MKKLLLWVLVLVMSISLVLVFSSGGCRRAVQPVEEPVAEEVTDEPEEEALDESEQLDESSNGGSKDNNYVGTLTLNYTNDLPAFNETAHVDVEIDKYGKVTFSSGTLNYEGYDTRGDFRIKRTGTVTINPNGYYFYEKGVNWLGIKECASFNENFISWYRDNQGIWHEVMNETPSGTWEGLAFSIDDAVINGSVIAVSTEQGSVTWTLVLVPVFF
jgi:hypothetical protein